MKRLFAAFVPFPVVAFAAVQLVFAAPPTASFTISDPTLDVGQQVTFDASASSDPDGDITTYEWDFEYDGGFDPTATGVTASHAYGSEGPRSVALRVTDDVTNDGTADSTISVRSVNVSVVNRSPTGGFTFSPGAPLPGEPVSFTSSSTPSEGQQITSIEWDFDYDPATGSFSVDATGASATHAFASPGPKRVAIRATEGPAGGFDIETLTVVVNAAPQAEFTIAPESPIAGDPVTILSTSSDPDGPLAKQEWDLDEDGQFDDAAGAVARATFPKRGTYSVDLRVTDSNGATSTVSHDVNVGRRPLPLLSGVLIQIRGRLVGASTRLTRLLVRAPKDARVSVRCLRRVTGSQVAGCPRRVARRSKGRRLRFGAMERLLSPGTKVIVTVTRRGFLGRYTLFRMRARKEPLRRDRCIRPGAQQATRCPRS